MNNLVAKLAAFLEKRAITTEKEITLYLLSFVATAFCLVTHIYLLVAYILFDRHFFVVLNIISISVYALTLFLHSKKQYTAMALILSIDVTLYATLVIFYSGISTYIVGYYLLVIILQTILPYGTRKLRIITTLAVIAVGLASVTHSLSAPPPYEFTLQQNNFLTLSNIYIILIGAITQLVIGNVIRRIVASMNEGKITALSEMANTDELTGLFNRRYANFYFSDILPTRKDVAHCVAMLDIDDFKQVNDTYGHACGDEMLVALSGIISSNLRRSDLVFRWGGEEFLIVLEDVEMLTAYTILEKLRVMIAGSTIHTTERALHVSVTIGVAILDPRHITESIANCDSNLYIGKSKGKNMVVAG